MKCTLPDGTVLDGTPGEIAEFDKRRADGNKHGVSLGEPQAQSNGETIWTPERAQKLRGLLRGDQMKLVTYMLQHDGKATMDELRKRLDFKKGLHTILSAITRNARKATEYKKARVILREYGPDGKRYYRMVPEVFDWLKQVGGI